jgi:predicted GNAT family acetyltransferase
MNSKQAACPFVIRRLAAADAECYRALRLTGLHDCPEAFGASYEDEASKPVGWFADRLEANVVFGAWQDVSILVAIAGLRLQSGKSSHKAQLWGMFVSREARRAGLATALWRN